MCPAWFARKTEICIWNNEKNSTSAVYKAPVL